MAAFARLRRWFRRTPGPDALARWQVDAATWQSFLADESRREGPINELPMPGEFPAGGLEVVAESDALWFGPRRVSLPERGTPEILEAGLDDSRSVPTLELVLKVPMRVGPSGTMREAEFTRLSVPVPGAAWREARKAAAHYNRDTPGKADFFHGRGDGSDPEDLSTCPRCGHQTYKFRSQCERCGTGLQSRRWARRFGALLVLCGLILTGLMGGVLYFTGPILYDAIFGGGTPRFRGSPGQGLVVLGLLGTVFVSGATCLVYGGWQIATGRTSLKVAGFMVTVFGGLMAAATVIPWLLG